MRVEWSDTVFFFEILWISILTVCRISIFEFNVLHTVTAKNGPQFQNIPNSFFFWLCCWYLWEETRRIIILFEYCVQLLCLDGVVFFFLHIKWKNSRSNIGPFMTPHFCELEK